MKKLAGIKEVIFEGWAASVLMKADPQFSIDESTRESEDLWISSQGTYAGVPCRLGEVEYLLEREKSSMLTPEELKELGISYPEGKEYYKEGNTLYVRSNQEVSSILGI